MKLVWREDRAPGFTREISSIGPLTCSITVGGAGTVGKNVYVGELGGDTVAISPSAEACEEAIILQAKRESERLGEELAVLLK